MFFLNMFIIYSVANKKCKKKKKEHLMTILFLWMQSLEWAHRKYVCRSKMSAIIHKKGNMHKMRPLCSHFYHYLALKKQQIVDNSLWNFFFLPAAHPRPLFDLWLQFLISGIYSMWLWEQSNVFALHQAENRCNAFMATRVTSNTSCLPTLHLVIWSQLCLNSRQ